MRFGLLISFLLHIAVVGAAFLDLLPIWPRQNTIIEPYIPLELIAEAELDLMTSVPAAAPAPVEEEPEPEPDLPEEPVEEEPPAPVKEPEPEPDPAPVEPEPEPAPVVEDELEEPEPTPKPEPEKPEELDLAALSKLIDKERETEQQQQRQTPSQVTEEAETPREAVGAGDRLTASDEAKMRAAVERCWNASAIIGAPEPEKLVVVIEMELNRDGTLVSAPKVANSLQINLSGNRFWKVAEQAALRAVVSCAPYDFLPPDRYATWREFRLNFDPSQMAGF
ncbi:MAG: cell envelope integrity protein TolA [Marinicaulis sp.]|nr:cell envelope integrity protein TolA [Marinicaulis sp.]